MLIIDRIVSQVGRRVDESSPMVDARLRRRLAYQRDYSAARARRSSALDPALRQEALRDRSDWWTRDRCTREMCDFLRAIVKARLNIIVCGGTGSGKTTMFNCLSAFIPEDERIVTIEDSAELSLQQPHVVRLETRPTNVERKGEVTQRDLVKNSLRMRPDRIIVGEVRGAEVSTCSRRCRPAMTARSRRFTPTPARIDRRLEMMMLLSASRSRSVRCASRLLPPSTWSSTSAASPTGLAK